MDIYGYVVELSKVQSYAKDVRPGDSGFTRKYAKFRSYLDLALNADLVADYRQWVAENPKSRELLIHAVARSGYKLSVQSDAVSGACRCTAYANFWSMPDAGLGLVVTAPNPSEGLLRVCWAVTFVCNLNVDSIRDKSGGASVTFHDPWADM